VKKYRKNLILALVCFLIVIVLNFFLPRLLPGNPIAYLTGFSEEDMTPAQVAYYRQALHLDKPVFVQFGYYLRSLADGTLGYSYKKEATVSTLIGQRLGYTLQITLPAVLLSTVIGLLWGLRCGYKKGSSFATAYFCRDILPRDLILEELREYRKPLKEGEKGQ